MEKTIQVALNGIQFQLTEAAYEILHAYLERLKARFLASADGTEIVRDIEARIAEKLLETKHHLISADDVSTVIADIGDASAFSDESESDTPHEEPKEKTARKRLYRDMDNAYLGGVSSGIAAYFNIDPLWVRLAFLISILSGGAGIVIYLILWLLIPEAKSASQKLEMSGKPVNLETIAGMVKERFEEAEKSGVFARTAHMINTLVRRVFGYIGKVIGAFLSLGSFFAVIGASVLLGIVMINWNAPWNDIPHKEAISPYLLKSALLVGYTAIVIPLVLIFSLGYRLMLRRTVLNSAVGFGLMGIWALSLVGSGVLATRIAGDYYAYTASSPEYAQVADEHTVEAFHTLNVEDAHVTLKTGSSYSVRIEGRKMDLANASTSIKDGVLTVASVPYDKPCLFCGRSAPTVIVTVPSLDTMTAHSGFVTFDGFTAPAMKLDARNSSISGQASIVSLYLSLDNSWTGIELTSRDIRVDARNTRVELEGTADTLYVVAKNASFYSEGLKAQDATIDAQNSSVRVRADRTFKVENDHESDVQNAGTAAGVSDTQEEIPEQNAALE